MRVAALLVSGLVAAGMTPPARAQDAARYAQCVQLARTQAAQAFEQASVWRTEGGGAAARHCQGLALVQLGEAARAAAVLDGAADDLARDQPSRPVLRARVMAQAGNAWLLAGDAARAESRLGSALALMPDAGADKTEMYIDRARARAELKAWAGAIADLDLAAARAPQRADVALLRASARRLSGDLAGARVDLDRAAQLAPDDPEIAAEAARLAAASAAPAKS